MYDPFSLPEPATHCLGNRCVSIAMSGCMCTTLGLDSKPRPRRILSFTYSRSRRTPSSRVASRTAAAERLPRPPNRPVCRWGPGTVRPVARDQAATTLRPQPPGKDCVLTDRLRIVTYHSRVDDRRRAPFPQHGFAEGSALLTLTLIIIEDVTNDT